MPCCVAISSSAAVGIFLGGLAKGFGYDQQFADRQPTRDPRADKSEMDAS
jgi:hypothetical protein